MSQITLETSISRREDVMTAGMTDGELVMMSMERGMYYGLQTIGTYIWNQIDKPQTVSELCEHLLAKFQDVEPEQCREDVLNFLNELHGENLIHVHQSQAA